MSKYVEVIVCGAKKMDKRTLRLIAQMAKAAYEAVREQQMIHINSCHCKCGHEPFCKKCDRAAMKLLRSRRPGSREGDRDAIS